MKELILKYLKGDMVIWVITLLLLALSIVTVYSFVPILVKMEGSTPFHYLFKHLIIRHLGQWSGPIHATKLRKNVGNGKDQRHYGRTALNPEKRAMFAARLILLCRSWEKR